MNKSCNLLKILCELQVYPIFDLFSHYNAFHANDHLQSNPVHGGVRRKKFFNQFWWWLQPEWWLERQRHLHQKMVNDFM